MFQINTKLDYGLITLRSLALNYRNGPLSLSSIAADNHLPYHYLTQIINPLKRAGVVESYEGAKGGYTLTRKPEEISLREITMILAPRKKLNRCLRTDHHACKLKRTCGMSSWWFQFNMRFQKLIDNISLADLV